jgi:NADH-quinone oxidoreductase subunit C
MPDEQVNQTEATSGDVPFPFLEKIKEQNPNWIANVSQALGETTVIVPREHIIELCNVLKHGYHFNLLSDLCGADRGVEEDPRFEVNYHLTSLKSGERLRLKVLLSEDDPHVNTVSEVWKTANWHERETYDLVGIIFDNHPDLRRILLPSDWDGHALRKDYPLRGYEPYSLT